jgi:hypothetical protein
MHSERAPFLALPVDPRHPRLRFIDGAPEVGVPAEPVPEGATPPEAAPVPELGDAGKQAIDRMKEAKKASDKAAKLANDRADALQAQLDAQSKPAEEQALDNARKEGETTANQAANVRIVRSELKAAAAVKLANPLDALAFINPTKFEVDANGEVDSDALNEAIDSLLRERPYLASGRPIPFQGSGDGGAKPEPKPEASLDEQIQSAQLAGNWKAVISLENQKLASLKA